MANRFYLLLIFALTVHQAACYSEYKKVVLSNPEALCLDGSPGAYNVFQGALKNKWIVHFEGGGWCGSSNGQQETLQVCFQRSKTNLGSSSKYPNTYIQQDGILSDNPLNDYRDWSKVKLKYCTGTGHQGYKKSPVLYKGVKLYFKGQNVTKAQLNSLNELYGIFSSATTDLIISGESAGGLGALLWANYIKDRTFHSTKVNLFIDSGIFLDFTKIATGKNQFQLLMKNLMQMVNEQTKLPAAECSAAYPTQQWKCMFAEHLHAFIKVPMFAAQSLYDNWSIWQILGVYCQRGMSLSLCSKRQLDQIGQYRAKLVQVLKAIVAKNPKNGYWASSCSFHTIFFFADSYNQKYRVPCGSQNSMVKAIAKWEMGLPVSHEHMDESVWPNNLPCSRLKYSQMGFKTQPQNFDQILLAQCKEALKTNIKKNTKKESFVMALEIIVLILLLLSFTAKLIHFYCNRKRRELQINEEQQQGQTEAGQNLNLQP